MKGVIERKRYNTQTAEELARADNLLSDSDFAYCRESLFRTKKGAFFLAGMGGALSKYSRACGNGRCEGRGIIPLSEDEAFCWLEENKEVELLEKYFPDKLQDA